MKKVLASIILSISSLYAAVPNNLTSVANVSGQTGVVVNRGANSGGNIDLGTPNQDYFSPNVYPGGIDFDFGNPATPGASRDLNATSSFYAITKDASGNFLVCGFGNNSGTPTWVVARYTSSGVLDITFNSTSSLPGGPGYIQENSFSSGGLGSAAWNLVVDVSGNILVCGSSIVSGVTSWTVVSYASNGSSRNASFGPNSNGIIQETQLGASVAYSISLSSLTSTSYFIYTGGYTTPSTNAVITTISYTKTGARNPAYNP